MIFLQLFAPTTVLVLPPQPILLYTHNVHKHCSEFLKKLDYEYIFCQPLAQVLILRFFVVIISARELLPSGILR